MNSLATSDAMKGYDKGKKCLYLVSLSTVIKITIFPLDGCKVIIKSIEIGC